MLATCLLGEYPTAQAFARANPRRLAKLRYDGRHLVGDELAGQLVEAARYDVGPYTREVTTTSADAQRWCDRGLNWCFGYHHEEAVACFEKALEADPNCAMAHWGSATQPGRTTTSLGN